MLFLLFAVALASGPPVAIDDPALCIDNDGYLDGRDFPGGDCCSFVVCDSARLNKTGFLGKCMGGNAWNQELLVCDNPKYVTDCVPEDDCDVPVKTTALCVGLDANQCCVADREPVFTAGSDDGFYFRGDDREEQACPEFQVFNLDDCCCEFEFVAVDPCDDTEHDFFKDPLQDEFSCCGYVQCWQNRTGYDTFACMPPSVWNDEAKACDIRQNVMDCMNAFCGAEMTDTPCDLDAPQGDCCRNGLWYSQGGDATQYIIENQVDDKAICCPLDMDGQQMEFNFGQDVCCCEVPV